MKVIFNILSLFLLATIAVQKLHATAQYGDKLIINNDTVWIDSNPLEPYFERKGSRTLGQTEMAESCTALWRGYVATWKLENRKLYLVRVQTNYCGGNPIDVDMSKEFGTNRVLAKWVNHTIVRPKGELLQYVHMAYLSIYEEEIYYSFKNGQLIETKSLNYLERNKKFVFPGEDYLRDTINKIILKSINADESASFHKDSSCFISIIFNENGELDLVGVGYNREPSTLMEKTIVKKATEALKGFPRLMKVTHKRYRPPNVELYFSGYCLKNPHDKVYGCEDK